MRVTSNAAPSKRRNIYFRHPQIFRAFQRAIAAGVIKCRGASERIEELIAADLEEHAAKLKESAAASSAVPQTTVNMVEECDWESLGALAASKAPKRKK